MECKSFTKKGQPFVDVAIQDMGVANLRIDDLEDQRKEIIALSGIPSSFLSYPEPMELREQLVHVNVSLATEISNIQENFNENIEKLLDRIFELCECKLKPSTFLKIHLFPPVVLTLQLVESTLTSASNILTMFKDMPDVVVDPAYLLKQYVPFVDWDKLFEHSAQNKVKKSLENDAAGGQSNVHPDPNQPSNQPGGY